METIITNSAYTFDVFKKDGRYYMSVLTGGVAQHFVTITLTEQEVEDFKADENKAIATSLDVVSRPQAYGKRLVEPSIDPF